MTRKPFSPELQKVFDRLVQSPDRASLVEQIDFQLMAYRKNPDLYILPNSCKWMTPVLEEYGHDLEGWLRFVRILTDEFPKRSEPRMELQKVYKKINSRHDAAIRRERIKRGIAACERVHGPFVDRVAAQDYGKSLQHLWKLGRMNCIGAYRRKHGVDEVPYDEQRDILDGYWDTIHDDIDNGKVPHPDKLPQQLTEAKRLNRLYFGSKPENQE